MKEQLRDSQELIRQREQIIAQLSVQIENLQVAKHSEKVSASEFRNTDGAEVNAND
jgi:hypothetical protein